MLLRPHMLPSYPLQRYLFETAEFWSVYYSLQGIHFTPLIILVNLFRTSPSFAGSVRAMRPVLMQHPHTGALRVYTAVCFLLWSLLFFHKHRTFNLHFQTPRQYFARTAHYNPQISSLTGKPMQSTSLSIQWGLFSRCITSLHWI